MSTKQSFTAGQQVYDIHGHAGSYVAHSANGHLVEQIYDDEDGEPHYAPVQTWKEVFSTPPKERLTADIAELSETIATKHAQLSEIRSEIFDAESERKALLQHAKKNPQLADLYLWLEGKATHLVVPGHYSIEIGTVDDILRSSSRDRDLRLLSLYVDPKANSYWVGRSAYSDGSSGYQPCFLASSEEHAKEQARTYIADKLRNYNSRNDTSWIRLAIGYGVPVSEEQKEVLSKAKATSAAEQLKRAQDALLQAQAGVDAAKREFEKVNGCAA